MQKIIFVYDIFTAWGRYPNGLNPAYLQMICKDYDMRFDASLDGFIKRKKSWPGYAPALNTNLSEYRSINDLKENKINENCFYGIEPWGSMEYALGISQEEYPFTKYMSNVAKSLIRNGNLYLLINFSDEGGIWKHQLEKLRDLCNEENFPHDKIIFVHADFELTKKIPENFNIKCIYYPYSLKNKSAEIYNKTNKPEWEYWSAETHDSWNVNDYSIVTKDDFLNSLGKEKLHKGLYLNRRFRTHRIKFYKKLWEDGLLTNDLLYSYDLKMFDNIDEFEKDPNYTEFIQFLKINNPKHVDITNFDIIQGYGFEVKDTYLKTYFSIITETMFDEENGYISEKTWKPIAQFHSFIIFGRPGVLSKLKEFGFKTFEPWIDESYDSIENNDERFDAIYFQVKKIQSLSHVDLIKMIEDMKDILLHNNKLFLEYGKANNNIVAEVISQIKQLTKVI